jgi:hypothetical protein
MARRGQADRADTSSSLRAPTTRERRGTSRGTGRGASLDVLAITDLWPSRPPCSAAEREAADAVAARLRYQGLRPVVERMRSPTSPTWPLLVRALARLWCAAFLALRWPHVATGLAIASIVGGVPMVAGVVRFLPLLGGTTRNIVALRGGTKSGRRPVVVTAHLDTHPTGGTPLHRGHVAIAAASGWAALALALVASPHGTMWRLCVATIAVESLTTLIVLARRELVTPSSVPDDNTSGLLALARCAELLGDVVPPRDVWIVATAGATAGSFGLRTFLRRHRAVRDAWLVDLDALGTAELIASPTPPRFPFPGTPPALVRAVVAAARGTGDPLTVRRVRRRHSDARAALRKRVSSITLTAGLSQPAGDDGPDPANAQRAALIVDALVRSES